MRIEQNIVDAVALTEVTRIPVLFLSNPGLGKTTILKRYANNKGYHLETLIGSRFSPEEIGGYQVNNGGNHLTHLNPVWFNTILEKKKQSITTLLFIDEISTCSEAVQGALLSLIFDRTIGNGKLLPEDTIIVSAANYAHNLPVTMNIMTPTLNRFILINLNEGYKAMDLLEEFIDDQNPEPLANYTPVSNFSSVYEQTFKKNFKEMWKEIFLKYSDPEAALGYLDISNRHIDGLYADSEGYIYNHISGRTISYLLNTLLAYVKLGIQNPDLLNKIVDGLVGAGTCTFKNEKQNNKYRLFVQQMMAKLINTKREIQEYIPLVGDITKDIQAYMINRENTGFYQAENISQLIEIIEEIRREFTPDVIFNSLKNDEEIARFTTKMEAIIELQQVVSAYPDSSNVSYDLTKIATDFYGLYCDILKIKPDYEQTFGCTNSLFKKVVFLTKCDKKGQPTYARAALRNPRPTELPTLYYISKDECLLDAGLKKPVHDSDNILVVYYNDGIKKLDTTTYLRQEKKAA